MERVGARPAVVSGCEGKGDITVSLVFGTVAAIVSEQALRALWADRPLRKDCGWEELSHAKTRVWGRVRVGACACACECVVGTGLH